MDPSHDPKSDPMRVSRHWRIVVVLILAFCALPAVLAGCSGSDGVAPASSRQQATSQAATQATVIKIAAAFSADRDAERARKSIEALHLANPGQLVAGMAEERIAQQADPQEVAGLAALAEALGVRSNRIVAYLTPSRATTGAGVTGTPVTAGAPSVSSSESLTPTAAPVAATAFLPGPSATAAPPRALVSSRVNLRGGPSTAYPVIGQLSAGSQVDILARNAGGDWWQVAWGGQAQAWVAGRVVDATGDIGRVTVSEDIPEPPPAPTAPPALPVANPPAAAQPPPTAKPAPIAAGVDYRIVEQRLLSIDENGGCMGKHNIYIQVLDVNGAPLNGAIIQRVVLGETIESGRKDCRWHLGVENEGCAHFDIYGNGDAIRVVSDPAKGAVTSEVSRNCSAQDKDIPLEDLLGAGYCSDLADCQQRLDPGGGRKPQLCNGHYSWQVKFQRTW